MRSIKALSAALVFIGFVTVAGSAMAERIKLPRPEIVGKVSVEEALAKRRSVRSYTVEVLSKGDVSQLLWSAQGITDQSGKRAAPSAGALYPLTIYLVAGKVAGLAPGIYRYVPAGHALEKVSSGDVRAALSRAALGQSWVRAAPAVFAFAVNYGRMSRYGERGRMYADMEVGHAAENLALQAVALSLGSVPVGALREKAAAEILKLPENQTMVYLLPVGKPK